MNWTKSQKQRARVLALLALQSERYQTDTEYRDATDAVLDFTKVGDEPIEKLCRKYGWPVDNNFAAACANDNSISELRNATEVDEADCRTWQITAEQWRECIAAALLARSGDRPGN